jgi:hypothetical protein
LLEEKIRLQLVQINQSLYAYDPIGETVFPTGATASFDSGIARGVSETLLDSNVYVVAGGNDLGDQELELRVYQYTP